MVGRSVWVRDLPSSNPGNLRGIDYNNIKLLYCKYNILNTTYTPYCSNVIDNKNTFYT